MSLVLDSAVPVPGKDEIPREYISSKGITSITGISRMILGKWDPVNHPSMLFLHVLHKMGEFYEWRDLSGTFDSDSGWWVFDLGCRFTLRARVVCCM
jgi:Ni,Fe-hydrogenase I small subunit